MKNKNLVAIGGGTGLSVLLRSLKHLPINISAIVTMTDDGASSGRLRRDYGVLPPGDIRQCLVGLADDEELMTKLFEYRFSGSRGLAGHSFGNLFLLALTEITGNFENAVRESSRILAINGRVIPSTLADVRLSAELINGQVVLGESNIPVAGHKNPIKKVFLVPNRIKANPEAIKVIGEADFIIIGPGSLYTSIIPNLLIGGITKAIMANEKAKKMFICNVSTERGETEAYSVEQHLDALLKHSHNELLTHCLVNDNIIKANGDEGKMGSVYNISTDIKKYKEISIIKKDLIDKKNPLFHDPKKILAALKNYLS
jgi:uncharacterized cofD-like protein